MFEYCKTISYGADLNGGSIGAWCRRDPSYLDMYERYVVAQNGLIKNHNLLCKHLITLFVIIDDLIHSMMKCNFEPKTTDQFS